MTLTLAEKRTDAGRSCGNKLCRTTFTRRASLGTLNFASPVKPATAALALLLLAALLLLTFFLRCHSASPPFPLLEELLLAKMNLSTQLHQHKEARMQNCFRATFCKTLAFVREDHYSNRNQSTST